MLSANLKSSDYLWMIEEICGRINISGKYARCLLTDGDCALDAFSHSSIFQQPCVRLLCEAHLRRNFESFCPNNKTPLNDLFGSVNSDGVKEASIFDEISFDDFKLKVNMSLNKEQWQVNDDLLKWANSESRMKRHYERYNLIARVAGGFGFSKATTNILEGQNMLIKADIKDKTPLQDLIPKLENYADRRAAQFASAFFDNSKLKLKDPKKYLGTESWCSLDEVERMELLKTIGLVDMDMNSAFKHPSSSFPRILGPNLSEENRESILRQAKSMQVFKLPQNENVFIVVGSESQFRIQTNMVPINCSCDYLKKQNNTCPHIFAVDFKFPDLNLVKNQSNYFELETGDEKLKRLQQLNDGAKPGSSRRTGTAKTRNSTMIVNEIRDSSGAIYPTSQCQTVSQIPPATTSRAKKRPVKNSLSQPIRGTLPAVQTFQNPLYQASQPVANFPHQTLRVLRPAGYSYQNHPIPVLRPAVNHFQGQPIRLLRPAVNTFHSQPIPMIRPPAYTLQPFPRATAASQVNRVIMPVGYQLPPHSQSHNNYFNNQQQNSQLGYQSQEFHYVNPNQEFEYVYPNQEFHYPNQDLQLFDQSQGSQFDGASEDYEFSNQSQDHYD